MNQERMVNSNLYRSAFTVKLYLNEAIARASRSKRSENCSLETLTATVRCSRVSRALYTSPIPPAPMRARISYGPSLSPAASGISVRQLV